MVNSFEIHIFEDFKKVFKKLDRGIQVAIDKAIEEKIAKDPYRGSGNIGHLQGEFRGLRRIRVRRNWRIYFAICEECRKLGYQSLRGCKDCKELPSNAVRLFYIYKKG